MNDPFDQPTRVTPAELYTAGAKMFGKRYLLERRIGRGGMGEVWLARDNELGSEVALKFLPKEVAGDPGAVARLRREAVAGQALSHSRIVKTYGFHVENDYAAVSMAYIKGKTLGELQAETECGYFETDVIEPWIKDVCDALDYAHGEAKIIHRDLKPQNVMIEQETGRAVVMDFGIARRVAETHTQLTGKVDSGTLAFCSPQQAAGEKADPRDDYYSLGAMVYELLTGAPPFYQGNIQKQIDGVVPPMATVRRMELVDEGMVADSDDVSLLDWENVLAACLAKRREDRPSSSREFWTLIGDEGQSATKNKHPRLPRDDKDVSPDDNSKYAPERPHPDGGMVCGNYRVQIPQAIHGSDGSVLLKHKQVYSILLYNSSGLRADAEIKLDGNSIGKFRVNAQSSIEVRRPEEDDGKLTFYKVGSAQGGKALLIEGDDKLGRLEVTFWSEKEERNEVVALQASPLRCDEESGDGLCSSVLKSQTNDIVLDPLIHTAGSQSEDAHASPNFQSYGQDLKQAKGGTGLSGKSRQRFKEAKKIELDKSKAVEIHLQLMLKPRFWKPPAVRAIPGKPGAQPSYQLPDSKYRGVGRMIEWLRKN